MPPFQYSAPENRSANSIAALMQRQGEIEAQRAQASGQIWGQAVQNLGQHVAGTIQQATDPRRNMEAIGLQQAQQLQAGQQRLDQLTKPYAPSGPQPEGAGPAAAQHPYLDENGLYDIPKLTQALGASGMTHLAPDLLKGAEAINDSILKHQELQQKTAQAETVLYGDLADGALKLTKAGMPFDQALDLAAAPALATKRVQPQQFAQIKAQLVRLPPEQQQAALGTLMDAAEKVGGDTTLAKDAVRISRYDRVKATNVVEEPGKGDYTINGQRFNAKGEPKGAVQPTQTAPKSYQKSSVLLDGKPAEVLTDPMPGGKVYDLNGTAIDNAAGRIKPIPPASVQLPNAGSGEASDATAKLIAEYKIAPPSARTLATPAGEALMLKVMTANPSYDAGLFTNRAPTRKAFTTGTQGQQLTAMNTAIEHLDQLQAASNALANGAFKPGNAAYNYLRETFGSNAPTNFDTIKNMVDKEVEAVANKGVPTVSGTAEQKALAGKTASASQIKGYIDTLIPLMGSKLNALRYQYRQAMGESDPFNVLTPEAEKILGKRGFSADAKASGTTPQSGFIEAVDPQGNVHHAPAGTPLPAGWKLK